MTRLAPDERCVACGGLLVSPDVVAEIAVPKGAEYICLKCGRPFRRIGQPPRLTWVAEANGGADEDGDDDA